MKKNISLSLLILVLAGVCFAAENDGSTGIYPVPRIEIEHMISQWFTNSGFTVEHKEHDNQYIELQATRGNQNWTVVLKHHSPLATEVQATYFVNNSPDQDHVRILWDFLSGNNKETHAGVDASNKDIPTAILSRIESVVCIKAQAAKENLQFSGFIIDDEGLILCTAHDLKDLKGITVKMFDGKELTGQIIKIDYEKDLALMNVDMKFKTHVSLKDGVKLVGMGEKLYLVGCPEDLSGTIYPGFVNGPPRKVDNQPLWQVNMNVYPGSSGSPVFNTQGNLVAVVKGRKRGSDSTGFLIPYETIVEFVKEKGEK